jgi:Tfp pilus assembly protein PilN
MAQSINLIPQQEMQEQQKAKAVGVSTVVSVVVLVVAVGVSTYFLIKTNNTKKRIKELDANIERLRSTVRGLSDIEIVARNLDKKYQALDEMLKTRPYYSMLLQEMNTRRPDDIVVEDLTLREAERLNISGKGTTYISVADFTNRLMNASFEGGDPGLKKVFTKVTLNSVSLENKSGNVNFSIVAEFDPKLLSK